jgi:hypothetical protein
LVGFGATTAVARSAGEGQERLKCAPPTDRSRRAISASEAAGGARFALRVLCFHRDAKHAERKDCTTICPARHHDRRAGRSTAEKVILPAEELPRPAAALRPRAEQPSPAVGRRRFNRSSVQHRCTFLFDSITSRRPGHTAWKLLVLPMGLTGVERLKMRQMCVRQRRQSGFAATRNEKRVRT